VATVPVEPHPLLAELTLPQQKGRIEVTRELNSAEDHCVWAVGDCAAIPLGDGQYAPPTAQHAVREAKLCAQNIVAAIEGQPLKPFTFKSLGSLASLGRRSAVAQVFGLKISGVLAWLLWRAVYLSKFPGLDRKIRILADWTMDNFLPRDITQVRIFSPAAVRQEHFEPGESLFEQGDVGDRIHFVIDGEAAIEVDGHEVATAGPGEVIGEIALVTDSPRTATVRAKTALDTASFSRETFHALVAHFPGVNEAMREVMARHLATSDEG
jgi:NADH:ubiquinone reductase (H+-translocating)